MKNKDYKILAGLQRLKRIEDQRKAREQKYRGEIPFLAHVVFYLGLSNILIFVLPGFLPDPLWALIFPLITFPFTLLISISAFSQISQNKSKGKNIVYTGLLINILFLAVPLAFTINPPTF